MPQSDVDPSAPDAARDDYSEIAIRLDEQGEVVDANFHATEFSGLGTISQGRRLADMPALVARVFGICPVSHLVASARACEEVMSLSVPPVAASLREMMSLAEIVQSHALSFFHLSSPELLFGFEPGTARRDLPEIAEAAPRLARDGLAVRRFGQQIVEGLGGRRLRAGWIVPGGVNHPLQPELREQILAGVPDTLERIRRTLGWYKDTLAPWADEASSFAHVPTLYLGLVKGDGTAAYTDGELRVRDCEGKLLADRRDPRPYWEYLGESVDPSTGDKSSYWNDLGWPEGLYRVGPLARLNVVDRLGTAEADDELQSYRTRLGRLPASSFYYHHARLIEILHCVERIAGIVSDPAILGEDVLAVGEPDRPEGVGFCEAPRGMLLHHYRVDEKGLVEWADLVNATGQNNLAMNRGVLEVARRYVQRNEMPAGMLNRVEAVIRCFDPCLSSAAYAIGEMPLRLQLIGPDGRILDELAR